jgi:hypothetical protein
MMGVIHNRFTDTALAHADNANRPEIIFLLLHHHSKRPAPRGNRGNDLDSVGYLCYKVSMTKEGFSLLYRSSSSGIDGQNLSYRIFPKGKDMFPHKDQVIGIFPP